MSHESPSLFHRRELLLRAGAGAGMLGLAGLLADEGLLGGTASGATIAGSGSAVRLDPLQPLAVREPHLDAMLIVADKTTTFVLTGSGDVLEPDHDVVAVGSGGGYALAAARALYDVENDPEVIARKAMAIAAEICVYTNTKLTVETMG